MAEGNEKEEGRNDKEGGRGGGRRKKETSYEERNKVNILEYLSCLLTFSISECVP